jgi:hypothetical protein
MANTAGAFGLQPFGQQDGASPTAGQDRYYILSSDTNSYFTGDLVVLSTAAPGFITLPASGVTTGQPILGVFNGCKYYSATVGRTIWNRTFPASVGSSSPCEAYIITNPQELFIVQNSTNGVLGSSHINMNIGYNSTSQAGGNTITGQSALLLGSSTVSANSSLPLRIVDVYSNYAPPGVNGTSTGAEGLQIMVVRGNNWIRNSGALTATST